MALVSVVMKTVVMVGSRGTVTKVDIAVVAGEAMGMMMMMMMNGGGTNIQRDHSSNEEWQRW